MLSRLFSALFVVAVATGTAVIACGGDDGGAPNNTVDAATTFMDAKVFMDAAPAMGIGQACTPPMTGVGQGDCPAGYTCLTLTGGAGSWCSKICTSGSGDMCSVGYSGPGVAACIYSITFGSGGSATPYCGVICGDTTGTCGSACNGTCPGALQCNVPLLNGSGGSAVGSACK